MKPVPNVTGIVKAAEANNNDVAKETVKPTPILTNPKATPEKSPLDGIGEFDKAFLKSRRAYEPKYLKTGLPPAPETEVWDEGLEGYIVHEDTKHITPGHTSKTSQLWPGSKRKHAKRLETIATMDEGKPILSDTPKRTTDMSQPPLPPVVPKPPLPMGPPEPTPPKQSLIPPLPPTVTSPLKIAAVNSGITQSKPTLAYSTNLKRADTTTLRRQANWDRGEKSTVGLSKRQASLSYTSTPSIYNEDNGDLRGRVNELRDIRMNQENMSPWNQHKHLVHRTKRFVKVVSENEAMPYNIWPGRHGYNQIKGTSANVDRKRCRADHDRGPQWEPRPVD